MAILEFSLTLCNENVLTYGVRVGRWFKKALQYPCVIKQRKNVVTETPKVGRGACVPPSFGLSFIPICPPYYYWPPNFLDDAASLS